MTPWRKVSDYAVTNGPQSISKKNEGGCSMYCLHEGDRYTKYSEDECEVVVAATYPDAESMKSYLATGGLSGGKLREQCLALWLERKADDVVDA